MVTIETNYGNFIVELDQEGTPETCSNFLEYARNGFYDGTIFHRVIEGFVIQGGGFDLDLLQKETNSPVENEAHTGGKNLRGTLAMARTSNPHSATSQFFINLRDNNFLDHTSQDVEGWGYCVFGKVVEGMDVIDKIGAVETTTRERHQDVPKENVIIKKVIVSEDE